MVNKESKLKTSLPSKSTVNREDKFNTFLSKLTTSSKKDNNVNISFSRLTRATTSTTVIVSSLKRVSHSFF